MSVWPGSESTFNPFTVTNCLNCGDPITQPKHGGRPRRYCGDKPACRKAGSRAARKLSEERADKRQREQLWQTWQRFHEPTTIAILEEILSEYGTNAASLATEALKREREARDKLAEARRMVAAADKKEPNLSEATPQQLFEALLHLPFEVLRNLVIPDEILQELFAQYPDFQGFFVAVMDQRRQK